ncbi:GNAT family N-acetyltransferase [Deinococcus daejeonensis]|uniref:N-acetyltransferase n=1 Tax=Deinococcus daejeonensis TaxID=1007098 RepID=A0ABQ2IUS8_9DEIO|nr:GNAT family N-acetyltransferase [Deinococcus daejeonensis]GGN28173.1 N-acetyltransferase [Deinococcus daejeonensis]
MTVTLRSLRAGDEEVAVRWAADPVFCRAADWTPGLAPRVVRRHWAAIIAGGDPAFLRLGVELDGRLVGFVDLAGLIRTPVERFAKSFNPSGASGRETGSGRGVGNPVWFRDVNETNGIRMSGTSAEFGIVIGERALWGRGVARRAGEALIAHAAGLGLARLTALVHAPNARSHALMRRLGFVEAGHAEPQAYMGEVVPVIRYEQAIGTDQPHS